VDSSDTGSAQTICVRSADLLTEGNTLPFRQTLNETQGLHQVFSYLIGDRNQRSHTFSLAIVSMTSSGGVPSSSVMMENWFTSGINELDLVSYRVKGKPTVFAWEERLSLQHLGEDAAGTPDINCNVVLLPGQHDLWCAVVPRRDITSHLRVLNTRQPEIADLKK
jgi:hypothetical protein